MNIEELIRDCKVIKIYGDTNINISSITNDSRKVEKAGAFVAVKGYATDGHKYIPQAIKKGASVIFFDNNDFEPDAFLSANVSINEPTNNSKSEEEDKIVPTFIKLENTHKAQAHLASNFYDDPSSKLTLIGVTGTNGKTTTATLLYNMFTNLGYSCGLLSTIANFVDGRKSETENTTSDIFTTNALMNDMVNAGCEFCFMEVSSIGQEQGRVDGLKFKTGIFSNLTHDHLDYHGTFAEYLRCKKMFFDNLDAKSYAITNIDDKNGLVMTQNTKAKIITYSLRGAADHNCKIMEESFEGMQLRIDGRELWTRLIGRHNAYNIMAIYCAALSTGLNEEEALIAISQLTSAPGRLETISGPNGKTAIIDYAHTPDALENVLQTLKDISQDHEIICVFGCGGNRDKTKRPEMAEIAEKYADKIIVTSDNNRLESIENIFNDIKAGFSKDGLRKALFISDRKEAIKTAFMISNDGAAILLAGKGHETYQINGNTKTHFDEKEVVNEIFSEN